ncbi:MAG: Crp/Fnr family transcriptional regulator [Bacteroidetes bacterium]|nr:Crp/Fnr family transcriptional regulator [Bacteroidota bacterium]
MSSNTVQDYIIRVLPLSAEDISLLMSCATHREVKKGIAVLKEGEICRSFYLVEKGGLRTYYNKNGIPINLNFTFEGNFVANLKSYKTGEPSDIIIEACEDASVWIFNIDLIRDQIDLFPEVSRFIKKLALRLLLASEEYSKLYKILTPAERYKYVEQNNPILLQRISLSQMASYLGVSRETLSRIRGKNSDNRL